MTDPTDRADDSARRAHRTRTSHLIPATGSVDDLALAVGKLRARPIELLPAHLGPEAPSGLWIATSRSDFVIYSRDASAAARTAIICHELAHMLLRHQPEAHVDQRAQLASLVAPNFDPSVAQQFLTRHGYTDQLEAEAEHLATVLVTQLQQRAVTDAMRRDSVSDRLR